MEPNAVIELERLANNITEHDLRMMISHGGANSVYEFLQRTIELRVNYLKHQQEDAGGCSMIASTLTQANQIKAASAVPMVVKNHASGYRLESLYHTLTLPQVCGLAVANELYVAFGKCVDRGAFHPIQFEIYDVVAKGKGAALANELRQLGLLQSYNGRYWLSPAGLNLINSIDNVLEH